MPARLSIEEIRARLPEESWLTPVGRDGSRIICKCRCGSPTSVDTYELLRGHTKSCGCWAGAHAMSIKQLNAELTTEHRCVILRRDGPLHVVCRCLNCGREYSPQLGALRFGTSLSCGCVSSTANPPLGIPGRRHREWRGLIDGLLLGDGHISKGGSFTMDQAERRRGWQFAVQRRFRSFGLKSTIRAPATKKPTTYDGKRIVGGAHRHMYTQQRPELKEERRRWYPRGRKVVPSDIVLTPECIAHWMAGDGCGTHIGQIVFATHGFSRAECELLVSRMPVHATVARSKKQGQYIVKVHRRDDAFKLAEIIGPHMPRCMLYKLRPIKPAKIRTEWLRKLTDADVRRMRVLARRGLTRPELAKRFGVSVPTVYRWLRRGRGQFAYGNRVSD